MRRLGIAAAVAAGLLAGCASQSRDAANERAERVDEQVRGKWGKPIANLPVRKLVLISPHNQNIREEYTEAFVAHYALEFGRRAELEWRDVGGGGTTIIRYVRNMFENSSRSGIDVLWGGGDDHFAQLAKEGLLKPMTLQPDFLESVPQELGGVPMYDPQRRWCGAALSGFGIIYNARLLEWCDLPAPRQWDDLAQPRLFDLLALADPTESSSAATCYEMVVQSAPDWPSGWAKLLGVLSNAKRFTDSAGKTANAPALGEALVATCIDFYGFTRVAEAPDDLFYISPPGQTAFTPDPIAILKNPPDPQLSQQFVDFVLSRRGQAIWALPPGDPDGPARNSLGRLPMRKDVYEFYAGRLSPWIRSPYQAGEAAQIDLEMRKVRFNVLQQLVRAAAIDNLDALKAAKRTLIRTGFPRELVEEFQRLPANVCTAEQIRLVARKLKDPTEAERIVTDWTTFFRDKYRRIAKGDT